jgi:hypothetical protein
MVFGMRTNKPMTSGGEDGLYGNAGRSCGSAEADEFGERAGEHCGKILLGFSMNRSWADAARFELASAEEAHALHLR